MIFIFQEVSIYATKQPSKNVPYKASPRSVTCITIFIPIWESLLHNSVSVKFVVCVQSDVNSPYTDQWTGQTERDSLILFTARKAARQVSFLCLIQTVGNIWIGSKKMISTLIAVYRNLTCFFFFFSYTLSYFMFFSILSLSFLRNSHLPWVFHRYSNPGFSYPDISIFILYVKRFRNLLTTERF